MTRVFAVAMNTFRETVRDRVIYVVLGIGCLLLFSTLALGELSLGEERLVTIDLGLATISLLSVLTTLLLGSVLLYKEIQRKTLYIVLPKPIRRGEFLVGKYAGIAMTSLVVVAGLGAVHTWILHLQTSSWAWMALPAVSLLVASLCFGLYYFKDPFRVWVPWAMVGLTLSLLAAGIPFLDRLVLGSAYALTLCECLLLNAVAMLFASFSRPFVSGLLTFGVWLVGRSAAEMQTMDAKVLSPLVRHFLHGVARVVPNFNLFVPGRAAMESYKDNVWELVGYTSASAAYAAIFVVILLASSVIIFARRDFA